MRPGFRLCLLFLPALLALPGLTTAQAQSLKLKTPLLKWQENGLTLELQAVPPDLVRAFFLARGFDKANADLIAGQGCIFRSSIGNSATKANAPAVSIDLKNWHVLAGDKITAPRPREAWEDFWQKKKIPDRAKTAFYWALMPTKQTWQPGDYNWGMISFALPAGTKFDLEISWQRVGKPHKHLFKNLECAK